ncbi:saccharopine dehydrogenase C-terminal domain-containing protein [Pinibacter aurantiacus]|uniref:Saccharopine dehydrogenase NADP-binding domain-containing protein n=1 Tax=Pinibacter aurantiacus TaxID=2851599 RepID=A0A9E2S8Y2_9BACT|nr:saccharopine dehydrogenase C-terminal domain-containing protein [Pinibacter aurantiacus]MBV4355525.1 saccharopine dehydrogenase NADP-binding domain-containing protein [Pinibacter aurantiacus]
MKEILVAGAGKSSVSLIEYLLQHAADKDLHITVADAFLQNAVDKINGNKHGTAEKLDVNDTEKRQQLVRKSDIVISMLPPALHIELAKDCLLFEKHLLTASYTDEGVKKMSEAIADKDILFLYEMGLDPGIDHMSAMQMIHAIQKDGGNIISFKSHCGGLVAPESDNNPWHYKISWNPANVVRAGKAGASFKQDGEIENIPYEHLFSPENKVMVNDELYSFYANRDSLAYIDLYNLHSAKTFVRTTLRHPDFIKGWASIVDLQLTDETKRLQTAGLSPADFFKKHVDENGLQKALPNDPTILEQFAFIDFYDDGEHINKGLLTPCETLQYLLEKNLVLTPDDKDMIVMLHEIEFEKNGNTHLHKSCLVVIGDDNIHTAMAKTVGLPLAIAATKILDGTIKLRGLHIPIVPEVYEVVMSELEKLGIKFELVES